MGLMLLRVFSHILLPFGLCNVQPSPQPLQLGLGHPMLVGQLSSLKIDCMNNMLQLTQRRITIHYSPA